MAYGSVHIPVGATVSVGDNIGALVDMGVLKGDASIALTWDDVKVLGSKAESLMSYVKNMAAEAKFTLFQLFLVNIQELLDGIASNTVGAGAPVVDHNQVVASGAWEYLRFIPFDGQQAAGTVPTNITVVASTDGALVADVDYFVIQNEVDGTWGFYVKDTVTVTTLNQTLTAVYDYTPAASNTMKMGAASDELTAKVVQFSKTINGKVFRVRLWSATNSGGITLGFPDSSSDEPASMEIIMKGTLDTTKATGEQLVEIYDELGLSL